MEIKLITNECDWDEFIRRQPYTLFVQSPEYRRFYESQGEKGWIWGIYEQEKLIGGSLVLTTHARRGNFLYLPYGPILNWSDPVMVQTFFNHLKNFAQKEHLDFEVQYNRITAESMMYYAELEMIAGGMLK